MHHANISQGIYVLEFITVILMLKMLTETCSEPRKALVMDVSKNKVHSFENWGNLQNAPTQMSDQLLTYTSGLT